MSDFIDTIYGRFKQGSKGRLDLTYDYESAEILAFKKILALYSPQMMLDIGANIGVYSIYVSDIPSISRVIAFEPAPQTFQLLKDNLAIQNHSGLQAKNLALSSNSGVAAFSLYGDLAGNNSITDTNINAKGKEATEIEVEVARLDDLFDDRNRSFACKIDVEGHEIAVLRGGDSFFSQNKGLIQIETFGNLLEVEKILSGLGYKNIFRLKNDYYFTNLLEESFLEKCANIFFEEVAIALDELKVLKRKRRSTIRAAKRTIEEVRFFGDPVMSRKD